MADHFILQFVHRLYVGLRDDHLLHFHKLMDAIHPFHVFTVTSDLAPIALAVAAHLYRQILFFQNFIRIIRKERRLGGSH